MQKYEIGDYVRIVNNLEEKADIPVNNEMISQQGSIHRVTRRWNSIQRIDRFCYKITDSTWTWTGFMLEPVEKKELKNY